MYVYILYGSLYKSGPEAQGIRNNPHLHGERLQPGGLVTSPQGEQHLHNRRALVERHDGVRGAHHDASTPPNIAPEAATKTNQAQPPANTAAKENTTIKPLKCPNPSVKIAFMAGSTIKLDKHGAKYV